MITCWPSLYRPAEGRAASNGALFERAKAPRAYARKKDAPRWAGSEFSSGYRSLANFLRAFWIVLDIDTATSREQVAQVFGNLCGIAHTTWTAGRWRVGILLDRSVTLRDDEFTRVQRAVIEHAECRGLAPEHGQSAAHCFGLPCIGGAPYEHVELGGALLDVEAALSRFPRPTPLPEPTRADRTDTYDHRLARASMYLERMPGAISGSHGHATTFKAAIAMVRGFGLEPDDALRLLVEVHNPMCAPAWSERDLVHKVRQAYQSARVPFGAIAGRRRDGRAA